MNTIENIENKDLVLSINSVPATIRINFDELKLHLEKELTKYELVVTIDTVKDAKKLSTELNKVALDIDSRRKKEIAKVSEPIKKFDDQMKELMSMCRTGRSKLLFQVANFEDETKKKVKRLLAEARSELFKEYHVDVDFMSANSLDLILISNITANGKLTKSAMDKLTSRVREDKTLQDMVAMRLVKLENASYKAGLSTPLTKVHILPFIKYNDENYEKELKRLLGVEVDRQTEAEKVMRKKIEVEKQQKEEAEQEKKEREKKRSELKEAELKEDKITQDDLPEMAVYELHSTGLDTYVEPIIKEKSRSGGLCGSSGSPEPQLKSGVSVLEATVTFEIIAPDNVSDEAIKEKLNDLLKTSGIASTSVIEIRRHA